MPYSKRLVAGLLLSPMFGGCWGKVEPCPGVVVGATYRVVVGRALRDDTAGCVTGWGLPPNTTFLATVKDTGGESNCMVGAPEISSLGGWTFQMLRGYIIDTGFLEGLYDGQFGECPVVVQLTVRDDASNQIACFQGTEASAECGMSITFQPKGVTGCSKMCTGRRAVAVTRL